MKKIKILIVEDDAITARYLDKIIRMDGYEVTGVASSGEEAVSHVENNEPDIILMDIKLNGKIDGIEASELIKQKHDIPVIFTTAYSDRATVSRLKTAEPYGYISKPINEKELYSIIDIALYKHSIDRELRESENKYRKLIDTLQEGIWEIDKNSVTTFANPRMAEMLGYSVDEMMGRSLFDFMDENAARIAEEKIERRMKGIKEQHYFEFKKRDGEKIFASLSTAPLFDEAGNYRGALAGVQDITERAIIEKARHESEELYWTILSNISDAVFITKRNGDFTYICPNFHFIFGYSFEEVREIGNASKLLGEEILERIRDPLGEEVKNIEYTIKDKSGIEHNLLINIKPVSINEGIALFTCRDITERKNAEEDKETALLELNQIFNLSRTGMCLISPDFEIIKYNDSLLNLFDLRAGDIENKKCYEIFSNPHCKTNDCCIQKIMRGEKVIEFENKSLLKNGLQVDYIISHSIHGKRDGKINSILVNITDITEKKKIEEKVLKSIDEERRRISRDIHDGLGQKLAASSIMIESLRKKVMSRDYPDQQEFNGILDLIEEASGECQAISKGIYPAIVEKNDLSSMLDKIARDTAKTSGINCNFKSNRTARVTDKEVLAHIYYIVNEAVNNSIKHGRPENIEISLVSDTDNFSISVKDDGKGEGENLRKDRKGTGLETMEYRAKKIGAGFFAGNAKKGGFEVSIVVYDKKQ